MPVTASGMNSQPVSSRVSRRTASRKLSPGSRWPAGLFSTRLPWTSSSTTRKRPSFSTTAATVTWGFQTMAAILYAKAPEFRVRFGLLPDILEAPELLPCLQGGVQVGEALVACAEGPVEQGCVVGDEIGVHQVLVVPRGATDLDVGTEPLGQGDDPVPGPHRRPGVYAHD